MPAADFITDLASEVIDADRLAQVAPLSPTPWSQRLGFLLELVGAAHLTDPLAAHVRSRVTETAPLSVAHDAEAAPRDHRWKLAVNWAVEPEA